MKKKSLLIRLDPVVYINLKVMAANRDCSMQQIIARLIDKEVEGYCFPKQVPYDRS